MKSKSRVWALVFSLVCVVLALLPSAPASARAVSDLKVVPSTTWRTAETSFNDWDFPDWCPGPTVMGAKIRYDYRATSSTMYVRNVRLTNLTTGINFATVVTVNGTKVVGRPSAGNWSSSVTKTLYALPTETVAQFSQPWSRTTSGAYMTGFDVIINSTTGGTGCSGGILMRFTRG